MFKVEEQSCRVKISATKAEWFAVRDKFDLVHPNTARIISANLGLVPREAPPDRVVTMQFSDRPSAVRGLRTTIPELFAVMEIE